MSINIAFSAKSKNLSNEVEIARNIGKEAGYSVSETNFNQQSKILFFDFCSCGDVLLNFYQGQITCECQTNHVGPGFHAGVVDFLDKFARECDLSFELHDEADYFTNRNFKQLQDKFNQWLSGVVHFVLEHANSNEYNSLMISWETTLYYPEEIPGTVISSMGRFPIAKLAEYDQSKENIELLAKEFFIWNDLEKNARFYRNSALTELWTNCYFMPSSRSEQDQVINGQIIAFLEKAVAIDPTLPFPKREYIELCELHGVKGISVESLLDYTFLESIGYRKKLINHQIGNLKISLPGYFLFEIQKQAGYDHLFYDNFVEGWHELRLTAFQGKKAETKFNSETFANTIEEPITLNLKGIKCRAAYLGESKNLVNDKPYYSVIAEALSDKQISLMTFSFDKESEKDWAFSLLNSITAVPSVEMEKQGLFSYVWNFFARFFRK
ncbi:MAG: hypothetical protein LBC02_12185 [Planctomycetaceae bacterium]|jgi:hypothetical protein|nr:hypothetical protein [Planctomycetaceae bacterium]